MADPYTILFVEDDQTVRESTAQLLALEGFRMLVKPDLKIMFMTGYYSRGADANRLGVG